MAAHNLEVHHRVPRCLLELHDRAVNGELDVAGVGPRSLACTETVNIMFSQVIVRVTEPGPSPASGPAASAVMLTGSSRIMPSRPLAGQGRCSNCVLQIRAFIAPF